MRHNWITVTAVLVIAAGMWEREFVQANGWFHQDDFYLLDWPLKSKFNWHLLGTIYTGHLMPGGLALSWFIARLSLYDWTLTSLINLAFLIAAACALLRLLRTMFGNRPAILIPLAVYMFCPLALPGLSFWSTTLNWVPTQLAIFMAIHAHITYIRSKRFRHAVFAAAWIAFGLLFDEADVFIPVLLLALTSAYLMSGGWAQATLRTLREHWRGWALYLVLAACYGVVFARQLHTSTQGVAKPGQFSNVLALISWMVRASFVPAALGGPWHWLSNGPQAFAIEVHWLTQLSWFVAAAIVLASLWYRRHAVRAWAILAGWIFLTAVLPLMLGRTGIASPVILGTDLHYLADSMPVLPLCLGLAFWPLQGEESPYRARCPQRPRQVATVAVLAGFLAGSLYSTSTYVGVTTGKFDDSYISTARVALQEAPPDAVIWSQPVPDYVQNAEFYGRYGYTGVINGLLAPPLSHLSFTTAPSGVYSNLLIFDGIGRLWGVLLEGRTVAAPAKHHGCFWVTVGQPVRVELGPGMFSWPWEISMPYAGPQATMLVQYSGKSYTEELPAGSHDLWVPAPGKASSVELQLLGGGPRVCVSSLTIGKPEASVYTRPIPATSVPG